MIIDYTMLEAQTLQAVIESFIQREGTDYGIEMSLDDKTQQVLHQLKKKTAVLSFDPETESINILSMEEAQALYSQSV